MCPNSISSVVRLPLALCPPAPPMLPLEGPDRGASGPLPSCRSCPPPSHPGRLLSPLRARPPRISTFPRRLLPAGSQSKAHRGSPLLAPAADDRPCTRTLPWGHSPPGPGLKSTPLPPPPAPPKAPVVFPPPGCRPAPHSFLVPSDRPCPPCPEAVPGRGGPVARRPPCGPSRTSALPAGSPHSPHHLHLNRLPQANSSCCL